MSKVQMGKPITLPGITLVPIEKVAVGNHTLGRGFWLYGAKDPLAVLVCDGDGVRVLSIQEQRFTLVELIRKVPELGTTLAQLTTVRERT